MSRVAYRLLPTTAAMVAGIAGIAAAMAQSLPQGGIVVGGQASFQASATRLDVATQTARTAIQWQSFSIAKGNTVAIQQPSAAAVTVNEVTGASPSQIFGTLTSNGRVVVANPNGIWFGPGSHVDVASLIASTATAGKDNLVAFANGGSLALNQPGTATASIENDGTITLADQGLAGFVAPGIRNAGAITVNLGQVQLASGTTATVDLYGDGLINFAVSGTPTATPLGPDGAALTAAIDNPGTITATGGIVTLTAAMAGAIVDQTINMSGVIEAGSATQAGGDIVLSAGTIDVAGTEDTSSTTASAGAMTISGHSLVLASTSTLAATGLGADLSGILISTDSAGTIDIAGTITSTPASVIVTGGFVTVEGNDALVALGTISSTFQVIISAPLVTIGTDCPTSLGGCGVDGLVGYNDGGLAGSLVAVASPTGTTATGGLISIGTITGGIILTSTSSNGPTSPAASPSVTTGTPLVAAPTASSASASASNVSGLAAPLPAQVGSATSTVPGRIVAVAGIQVGQPAVMTPSSVDPGILARMLQSPPPGGASIPTPTPPAFSPALQPGDNGATDPASYADLNRYLNEFAGSK